MKLQYVGPKVNVSKTGVDFDNNKEDKFVYLNIALQLLKALDHEYISDKIYTYDTLAAYLDRNDIEKMVRQYCDTIDSASAEAEESVKHYLNYEINRAQNSKILHDDEKEALINNLTIMRSYMIQRTVNKTVYYCIINKLADIMKKDHIDYVVVPMFQKFAHVFHSVQGVLRNQNPPIDSKMEIYEEDGKLLAKLDIHTA